MLAVSACASGTQDEGPPSVGLRVTPAGGDVEVEAYPLAFQIVDKIGQPARNGEGHVHFYLDVDEIPTTPNKPAVTSDESTYHATAMTTHVWKDVGSGEHTFAVQLVNNDHAPLEPPATAQQVVVVD